MGKVIEQLSSGLIVGYTALGNHGNTIGSVRQQVHDGDTIIVQALGNFGVRFLGIDAPELSFKLPGHSTFRHLSKAQWEDFFSDPFAENIQPFNPPLDPGLLEYLQPLVGPGVAKNHSDLAKDAEDALEEEILKDLQTLGQNKDDFRFFWRLLMKLWIGTDDFLHLSIVTNLIRLIRHLVHDVITNVYLVWGSSPILHMAKY